VSDEHRASARWGAFGPNASFLHDGASRTVLDEARRATRTLNDVEHREGGHLGTTRRGMLCY
jgi:hypothetical protein